MPHLSTALALLAAAMVAGCAGDGYRKTRENPTLGSYERFLSDNPSGGRATTDARQMAQQMREQRQYLLNAKTASIDFHSISPVKASRGAVEQAVRGQGWKPSDLNPDVKVTVHVADEVANPHGPDPAHGPVRTPFMSLAVRMPDGTLIFADRRPCTDDFGRCVSDSLHAMWTYFGVGQ